MSSTRNNQVLMDINPLTPTTPQITQSIISYEGSVETKQIHRILFLFLFIVSMILGPWKIADAAVEGIKWHPGHYYTILSHGKDKSYYMSQVYKELERTPTLRGIQVRYRWDELEKSAGVYNFASIDKHLAELTKRQRRLVIQVVTKSFNPENPLVPAYMQTAAYEGGAFLHSEYGSKTPKGKNIKLWNAQVRDRLIALFRALGERYNDHPNFEGIGLIETALGQPIVPITSVEENGFYKNLRVVHEKIRPYFPNTMIMQEVNYPRTIIQPLVDTLKLTATALSSPDLHPDEPGLIFKGTRYSPQGVYEHYRELTGIIPLAPTVMQKNYENTQLNGKGYKPTVSQLLAFARDELKANYIFWTREEDYYPKVLETLNMRDQKINAAGGLDTTCPSTYSSCID
jgi:hypothetical protein